MKAQIEFKDSQKCFDNAIEAGFLSTDKNDYFYAGNFMYMHSEEGVNYFKNIDTREYVSFIEI